MGTTFRGGVHLNHQMGMLFRLRSLVLQKTLFFSSNPLSHIPSNDQNSRGVIMNSDIFTELTQDIKKLYALEQSIIDGDHTGTNDLRSKQALLVSEVIQSLQKLKITLQSEPHFAVAEQHTFS
jgi:hypothetical protein